MHNEPGPAAGTYLPTQPKERVVSLDVLRGFALCGILVVNIQSFAMIGAAYFNPTAYGNFEGVNWLVWFLTHVLADHKFVTIFSMLFGAGIVLMSQRAEKAGRGAFGLHFRRMVLLILFGLLHAYLLWVGDILFLYGICGILVYFFRRSKPASLIVVGLLLISVHTLVSIGGGLSLPYWSPQQREEFRNEFWNPSPETYRVEVANYQGGWHQQMKSRVPGVISMHTTAFTTWGIWRVSGCMLIGMALFKLGVLSATRQPRYYAILCGAGAVAGFPIVLLGVYQMYRLNWDVAAFFLGLQFNYWGSLLVSLCWIGLVMLAFQKGWLRGLQRRLEAVGRLAFTNYLLQTVICTTVFYGHGLGLFGEMSRIAQFGVVLGVWILQLAVSPIWLEHFRMGPFEWLWRSLTYLELLPFRRAHA